MKSGLSKASRIPKTPRSPRPFTGRDRSREAAMLDSVRRQGGAVQHPNAAPMPPGVDRTSDSGLTKTVLPTGPGAGKMGSGFGWQ